MGIQKRKKCPIHWLPHQQTGKSGAFLRSDERPRFPKRIPEGEYRILSQHSLLHPRLFPENGSCSEEGNEVSNRFSAPLLRALLDYCAGDRGKSPLEKTGRNGPRHISSSGGFLAEEKSGVYRIGSVFRESASSDILSGESRRGDNGLDCQCLSDRTFRLLFGSSSSRDSALDSFGKGSETLRLPS